jgi:phosphomevalonate kinase
VLLCQAGEPLRVSPLSLPADLVLVPVWTGAPADTRELVAKVTDFARRDQNGYQTTTARIAMAASAFAAACRTGRGGLAAFAEAAAAAGALGRAAGVEIETEHHRRVAETARERGGIAKPTGAGGGDIALAALPDLLEAERFRADVTALGMKLVTLGVELQGAR